MRQCHRLRHRHLLPPPARQFRTAPTLAAAAHVGCALAPPRAAVRAAASTRSYRPDGRSCETTRWVWPVGPPLRLRGEPGLGDRIAGHTRARPGQASTACCQAAVRRKPGQLEPKGQPQGLPAGLRRLLVTVRMPAPGAMRCFLPTPRPFDRAPPPNAISVNLFGSKWLYPAASRSSQTAIMRRIHGKLSIVGFRRGETKETAEFGADMHCLSAAVEAGHGSRRLKSG
jgi:hypothetical protein